MRSLISSWCGERAYDRWLDDPFHKPGETLDMISEAPYDAVPVLLPGDVGTDGDGFTDECAGAGARIGPSITFGYIAAKLAANIG